ncbi:calmodulin, putative [Entamoeba histolytica HM-3:IMSS]|uniref:Calmodulin, putative n=6 Tax=Entamoeba TaxID=5758 RepID=C4MB98_ENTH1|nr:calmodulin, putative [Entamoeba dispar SAW760]XP_655757.1 calmodulin, putative [Entamoeba histolytica HM-1:IMSS]EMD49725.1 calmodulin, putative [Entamoeba histolytica KU27]EMS12463.1 calmodulin, putative [Entamoeba histolytica HM-3:IMSS]GAT99218.1 calmodulin putative [Entamoeba histolytica]EAL50371.1 calmodulin, putative [Entamoeba histolytica HM-1:IMSS]EDR24235.1 calmodulin, putative [Entamoeba dispar SAW760]|eukprot:EDR24235.1 calmodulin, putative [Entamoeba dispar SAW760]
MSMEIEAPNANTQKIRDCFNFYDRDYDGKIDVKQLGTLIRSLGCAPTEDEVNSYIKEFAIEGETFQIEQFELIMEREQSKPDTREIKLRKAFEVFDQDKDGKIKASDLAHNLTTVGDKMTKEEVEKVFSILGITMESDIDLATFLKLVAL